MADKRAEAIAKAVVPYIYSEVEARGIINEPSRERISDAIDIDDPTGETDGLYVEYTVVASNDESFPKDKDTGYAGHADPKYISYSVKDAVAWTPDDEEIDLKSALESALWYPDHGKSSSKLKEEYDGPDTTAKDPETFISYNIESYGDEIVEDVVKKLRQKYPNWKKDQIDLDDLSEADQRVRGVIRSEGLELAGKHVDETIKYDVTVNDMSSLSVFGIYVLWNKVVVTVGGKSVDITDDLEEEYTGENLNPETYDGEYGDDDFEWEGHQSDYQLDEDENDDEDEDYFDYGADGIDPDDPCIPDVADLIAGDIFDNNDSVENGRVYSGNIETDLNSEMDTGEEGHFRVEYKVKVVSNGNGKSFNADFTPIKVTLYDEDRPKDTPIDMTDVLGDYWCWGEHKPSYWDDKGLYESKKKNNKVGVLSESLQDLDYDAILEAILDDVCEKLEAKYPSYNSDDFDGDEEDLPDIKDEDMSVKGIVKGLFGGDRKLTVKYVANLDTVDEIQPYGISGEISRAIVIENGQSTDITDEMHELG